MTNTNAPTPPASSGGGTPACSVTVSCPCGGAFQTRFSLTNDEFREKCRNCRQKAIQQIAWARKMQQEHRDVRGQPGIVTASDAQDAVLASLARQGIGVTTGGTTDSSGNISVNPQIGPCADLEEAEILDHERVHQAHQRELEKLHGHGTLAYYAAWDSADDLIDDEVNAYQASMDFWVEFQDACSLCGV
jgi:hypothetical protein